MVMIGYLTFFFFVQKETDNLLKNKLSAFFFYKL